jgi:hypothetical protein
LECNIRGQIIGACRYQNLAPSGGGISGIKGGSIIRHAIADRAIIAHIDHRQHIADEYIGHIGNADIINPDNPAIRAGQIKSEMAKYRILPDHIDAGAQPGADNRRNLFDLTIAGQLRRGAKLRQTRNHCTTGSTRPARNTDRRQSA